MSYDGGAFMAVLTTRGRKTGRLHSVQLRGVGHMGRVYFSRRTPDADWFQNALADAGVRVRIGDATHAGKARIVEDPGVAREVSRLKYPGEARASQKRVVIEVTLYG